MKEYIFAIALTVFLFGGADDARSESDKCLNFGFSKINDDILKVADKIKSAMAASDICVNMVGLPSKRGTEEFRLGKLDGYGLRPSGWTKSNDLPGIRVPTKLLTSRGYFISRETHDDVMSVLKKKRVGIIRGSSWSDRLTAGSENAVEMTNASQLIYVYLEKHLEGILLPSRTFNLKRDGLSDSHVYVVSETKLYLWIHAKHASVVDKINDAIIKWKSEGNTFVPDD